MRWSGALLLGLTSLAAPAFCERWQMQYFYDEDKTSLSIVDIKFPSARRGIAVGYTEERDSMKPVSLITDDGGAHWTLSPIKEQPLSLFFFNDSLGWMVTAKGIWQTEEAGRTWRKKKAPQGIIRVYFTTPDRGWAIGIKNQVYTTTSGGDAWEKLAVVETIKARAEFTTYAAIDFTGSEIGLIAGWNRPPRRTDSFVPEWADPQSASHRRAWPGITIVLDTRDGGTNWTPTTASIFGQVTQVRLTPQGGGLALIEHPGTFEYPSEVTLLNWKTGKSTSAYRDPARHVTDIGIVAQGAMYIAAVEQTGRLHATPIPTKVILLKSDDSGEHWTEQDADYRAVARAVRLAISPAGGVWAATDTGMILKLIP
ncbi:MAG: hypothetical protein ABIZ80_19480 [Bryobacteraceae bacterium]